VHTQGHAQPTTDARLCVATTVSGNSVRCWRDASPSATRPLRRTFRGDCGQVPLVRDFVSRYLDGCHCPAEAVQDILVCATELAANAVLHSRSGLPGGQFNVEVACAGQAMRVTVADSGGPWTKHADDDAEAEGGRGLHVVAALSANMGITGDAAGRVARFFSRWGTGEDDQPGCEHAGSGQVADDRVSKEPAAEGQDQPAGRVSGFVDELVSHKPFCIRQSSRGEEG
jgi:anti-sigma regulatory factor (Ser/Thr protein kinase)